MEAVIRLHATREYESGDIVDNPLTPSMPRSGGRRGGLGGGGGDVCQRRSSFIFPFHHVCLFCLSSADHKDSPVCLVNQSALTVAWRGPYSFQFHGLWGSPLATEPSSDMLLLGHVLRRVSTGHCVFLNMLWLVYVFRRASTGHCVFLNML